MNVPKSRRVAQWRMAWAGQAFAIAIHVVDEAWNDFLAFYNPAVSGLRADYPWAPLPMFTFDQWIVGLILGVLILIGLTPFVSPGRPWIRLLSYALALLMIVNALSHTLISIWLDEPIPGAFSSPVLLVTAVCLLVTTWRARHAKPRRVLARGGGGAR
jgi:hypothetical protein